MENKERLKEVEQFKNGIFALRTNFGEIGRAHV